MVWVHAPSIIADVIENQAVWHRPDRYFKGNFMRQLGSTSPPSGIDSSVPISSPREPLDTPVLSWVVRHLFQESFNERTRHKSHLRIDMISSG